MHTVISGVFLLLFTLLSEGCNIFKQQAASAKTDKKHVILVGASVGQEWNLSKLPMRKKIDNFSFESIAVWQFDKTDAIDEVIMRPIRKFRISLSYFKGFFKPSPVLPDLIIIKECAAYFPGDFEVYKGLTIKWINQIKAAKIDVMIATVAPVTKERAQKQKGKIEGINEYNAWLRTYAQQEGIPLLDIAATLITDTETGYLREDLTSGDGLHLNSKAYAILDSLLFETRLANSDKKRVK